MAAPLGSPGSSRTFFREIGVLIGLPAVAALAFLIWWAPWGPGYAVPAGSSVFSVATGTWDWTTANADSFCIVSRHRIEFSADQRVMTIVSAIPWTTAGVPESVAVYDISAHSNHHVRGQIRGETRLTDAGKPVVWDLELTSDSSYTWHRADWASFNHTAQIRRCPASRGDTAARPPRRSPGVGDVSGRPAP